MPVLSGVAIGLLFINVKSEPSHAFAFNYQLLRLSLMSWKISPSSAATAPAPWTSSPRFSQFSSAEISWFSSPGISWSSSPRISWFHQKFTANVWALNCSLDNSADRLGFAILARARAASRPDPASDELPWVEVLTEDQLGEDAEQESCRAGDVQLSSGSEAPHPHRWSDQVPQKEAVQ